MAKDAKEKAPGVGSGVDIHKFVSDARTLSLEEFEDRNGSAFLLLTASRLRDPLGPCATVVHLSAEGEPAEQTASVSTLIYSARHTGRSVGPFVTLGRTLNNDIVIPDRSVSRFHAFLKLRESGRFEILDAGSTNGTIVNGGTVPAQGKGSPVELKAGDTLRLGQVELTYLGAEAFCDYVLKFDD
jgi:hypothetical protein